MTNIIHTNFGLKTLLYKEYKNFGSSVNTSKRVTWVGFKVIMNILEAKSFTLRNFIRGSESLNSTRFSYKLDL